MIKFIKKHKLNFIGYLFCAFAMALFTIVSFSCKTYAFTIDNNGNLVGDNLFDGILVNGYHSGSNGVLNESDGQYVTNKNFIYIGNIRTITVSWSYKTNFSIYLDGIAYYDNNKNFISYEQMNGQTSPKTVATGGNEYYISINFIANNNISYNNIYNVMINYGETAQEWEPYGVWYSSANYDTLENQLNTTNGLLDLQIDITKYGWLSYIDNLEYYVTNNYVQTFTFNDLKTNNYISNNATLDLYQMSLYQNPNYSYIKFDIYFQNSYANLDYFSANLFDISTKLGFNGVVSIYDTDSNSAVFNITDIASITYEDIIEKNSNFGDYIYNVVFEFASPDAATMIYTNSFYSRGYQTGYSYGSNVTTGYYTPIINDLNARISNLENNIVSLNNTIDTLKDLNAQYQQQLADNVGWSSLFFAFADTPFKVVSNVLGFELFGLNLFATFIGMITVFGVVYLLKKFL